MVAPLLMVSTFRSYGDGIRPDSLGPGIQLIEVIARARPAIANFLTEIIDHSCAQLRDVMLDPKLA